MPNTPLPDCVRAFYDAFTTGDFSLCQKAVAPTWENYPREPGQGSGVEAFRHTITLYRAAFSDLKIAFERVIADDAHVALRIRVSGVTTGRMHELVESRQQEVAGTTIHFDAHDIHTLAGGRIVESRHLEDWLGIFRQAGVPY